MFRKTFSFALLTFFYTLVFSQDEHFLVELEPFSPDVATMIQMMEGNPAESFEALDMNGQKQNFEDFSSKSKVFWFWSINDEVSAGLVEGMNLMNQIFDDRIKFLSFTYESSADTKEFATSRSIEFDVVPGSLRISDLLYGSEMGIGRVFLIGKSGIVKKALPRQFFIDNQNSFNQLRTLIQQMIDEEN